MTLQEIQAIDKMLSGVKDLPGKLGKDGERIKAFFDDLLEAGKTVKTDAERTALLQVSYLLVLSFQAGVADAKKSFFLFADPFKRFRIQADDIARTLDFKRYKKLRNL